MGAGYTGFLLWALSGALGRFYRDCRWPGWEQEEKALGGDQGFAIYPPPCAAGPPDGERHRGLVPPDEPYRLRVGEWR
jgi:hypothetical protein